MTNDAPDPEANDISSRKERERILVEAFAHAEVQEALYRQPLSESRAGRWKTPLAIVVLMLAAYLGLAPPSSVAGEPFPQVSAEERQRGVYAALQLQARQIEVFRARNSRLPRTLDEVPVRVPGVRFVRSNSRIYQLVATFPDGRRIVYDAARPDPEFAEIESRWHHGPRP